MSGRGNSNMTAKKLVREARKQSQKAMLDRNMTKPKKPPKSKKSDLPKIEKKRSGGGGRGRGRGKGKASGRQSAYSTYQEGSRLEEDDDDDEELDNHAELQAEEEARMEAVGAEQVRLLKKHGGFTAIDNDTLLAIVNAKATAAAAGPTEPVNDESASVQTYQKEGRETAMVLLRGIGQVAASMGINFMDK